MARIAYYSKLIYLCLSDLRERLITNPHFEGRSEYQALMDYLKKHEVDELYFQLQNGSLPKDVRNQYDLYTDEVQEIAR